MKSPAFFRLLFVISFTCLFIVTLPFHYQVFPDPGSFMRSFFEAMVKWSGTHIFGAGPSFSATIASDSVGMYIHVFNCLVIAFVFAFLYATFNKRDVQYPKINYWFQVFISYYLALQLLKYGFDKVFKAQFYLPEPNTLFTPLANLTPDILYWSAMGTSRFYSVFMGLLEIIPAILLLFKPTRVIGAMIASLVLLNVVMINFGFAIPAFCYCLPSLLPGLDLEKC